MNVDLLEVLFSKSDSSEVVGDLFEFIRADEFALDEHLEHPLARGFATGTGVSENPEWLLSVAPDTERHDRRDYSGWLELAPGPLEVGVA